MLKLVLLAAVAVPVAAAGAVAATGVVVVDVREAKGGSRIVVPVPLALAQVAAAFVPERLTQVPLNAEARRYMPAARQALAALAEAEDTELVRVEEPGQEVSIRKEGGLLKIRVMERGEEVNVQVPIALAQSVLADPSGRVSASGAVWALQRARLTQVVNVQSADGDQVKITVY